MALPTTTVLQGLDALIARRPNLLVDASRVIHATTLVTNTIIERKGAKTGLVTTAGFRDILELQREVRYDLFDMFIRLPEPIVPRRLRVGVPERVLADGRVLVPLDEAAVREAAALFRREKVEAVAVVFLHSYRNGANERRAAEILAAELPGCVISVSHEVYPEPKEYERSSTTVLDAYVKTITETYLDRLQEGLAARGHTGRLFAMLSNGGTATAETAKRVPVEMVESGPAAGVEAASFFGGLLGLDRVLSFDMGGTTAKLCIIENGRAARSREFEVDRVHRFKKGSGLPVAVPVYDLLEIGAGGGSIARLNNLGLMQVGPDSAGADPGPACYGGGGTQPTVTDADLVLGYLGTDSFLGGAMRLDRGAAERALAKDLAAPGGLSVERAAAGVNEIVNETMASAARMYVAEKGFGPSNFTLIAFGGAGPVHAMGLARKLGCRTVIVPPLPGVMSSIGLLTAPVAFERNHAIRTLVDRVDLAEAERTFGRLEDAARASMPKGSAPTVRRIAELRYSGQDHALAVDTPLGTLGRETRDFWKKAFVAAYHANYGKIDDDNPIELASVRVLVSEHPAPLVFAGPKATEPARPRGSRRLWCSDPGEFIDAPIYDRATLAIDQEIIGPAIIEERESTTILDSSHRLVVDRFGCLVIALAASEASSAHANLSPALQPAS